MGNKIKKMVDSNFVNLDMVLASEKSRELRRRAGKRSAEIKRQTKEEKHLKLHQDFQQLYNELIRTLRYYNLIKQNLNCDKLMRWLTNPSPKQANHNYFLVTRQVYEILTKLNQISLELGLMNNEVSSSKGQHLPSGMYTDQRLRIETLYLQVNSSIELKNKLNNTIT